MRPSSGSCVTVLIAESVVTVREQLKNFFRNRAGFEVVGEATDGREAVELTKRLRPRVVLMGAMLPVINGFQATKEIMIVAPTPTLMLFNGVEAIESIRGVTAYQAGALSFLPEIPDPDTASEHDIRKFLEMLETASRTKVTRHWRIVQSRANGRDIEAIAAIVPLKGAPAFRQILSQLPDDFRAPILVVPSLGHGLGSLFQTWLSDGCRLDVRVAVDGEPLAPGTVYIAPEDYHLVVSNQAIPTVETSRADPIRTFRPSGIPLLESMAAAFGPTTAVLMMDGLREDVLLGLCAVWIAGGRVLAHERDRCVSQIEEFTVQLVDQMLPAQQIVDLLIQCTDFKASERETKPDSLRIA